MRSKSVRVGTFTLGATLAGVGVALLRHNLEMTQTGWELWRLWPLLPLILGLEYLIRQQVLEWRERSRTEGEPTGLRLDGISLFVACLTLLAGIVYTAIPTNLGNIKNVIGLWRPYEYRTEIRQDLTDLKGVQRLIISHQQGSVQLEGTDDTQISVIATVHTWAPSPEAAEELARQVGLSLTAGPDARVELKQPGLQTGASRWTVDYRIRLPKTLAVRAEVAFGSLQVRDVTALELSCRNGTLEADRLSGPATLTSIAGSLRLNEAAGSVTIDAEQSSTRVQDVAGKLRITSLNGSVAIFGAGGAVEVISNNGDIRVVGDRAPAGDWNLTTRSGLVDVQIPASSSISLTALARFGSVAVPEWAQVTQSGDRSSASGTLGQGQYRLRLQTDRGRVGVVTE